MSNIWIEKESQMKLEPYQQRVVQEKAELDAKLEALFKFFGSSSFKELPVEECERLSRQWVYMSKYSRVLEERIGAFRCPPPCA